MYILMSDDVIQKIFVSQYAYNFFSQITFLAKLGKVKIACNIMVCTYNITKLTEGV